MLPVTKHRTVHVPNSLAVIAALFCLAVLALHGLPDETGNARVADGVPAAGETAPERADPADNSGEGLAEQAGKSDRRSDRRLGFTFFLFPSRG